MFGRSKDYGKKGVSLRDLKKGKARLCSTCLCVPCGCDDEARRNTRRQSNADNHNQRKAQERYDREHGGKKQPVPKAKKLSSSDKRRIVRDAEAAYRSRYPTASDAKVKKAGKEALRKAGG